ncbi:MAG: Flp pilus assembly protein CpaB [Candidatus Sericytochromatia bacterium]|nr:Flp pilus assembly protein CpaB [Candidatus Tanganyikabacteria bacterium]
MMVPLSRLALAVVVGLSTSALFFAFAGRPQAGAGAAEAPSVPVLVLKEEVKAGRKVEPYQIGKAMRPVAHVPDGAVPDTGAAVGRVAKADLLPGDILVEGRLFPPGRTEDLPQVLPVPPGKRAVTVAVDEVVGVAGFVMPGTGVDVVGTMDLDGQAVTRVILQNILVLAIAQDAKRKDDPEAKVVSSATLAVTPQESQVLILAADRGKIRLAMRSPKETDSVQLAPVTPFNIVGRQAPRERAAQPRVVTRTVVVEKPSRKAPGPAATPFSIMVIRGTHTETVYREDR